MDIIGPPPRKVDMSSAIQWCKQRYRRSDIARVVLDMCIFLACLGVEMLVSERFGQDSYVCCYTGDHLSFRHCFSW